MLRGFVLIFLGSVQPFRTCPLRYENTRLATGKETVTNYFILKWQHFFVVTHTGFSHAPYVATEITGNFAKSLR